MKMALLLAGQARSIDKLPYHPRCVLRLIEEYKPDVFCAFWDEPETRKALDLFEPKRWCLSTEEEFQQDKEDWWSRWSKIVSEKDNVEHRRKRYWGETPGLRSRDNTIRHWSRMTAGMHLINEPYDIVVVTRTDIDFKHKPTIGIVEPMKLYAHSRTEGTLIDRLFWGHPDTIFKLLNWTRMINAMAHAELNGKHGRRPMALVKGAKWLGPENTLMVTMQYCNIEHVKQQFHTDIIR